MSTPEEQQIQICLLKTDLQQIENYLVAQSAVMPMMDADNEQEYSQTMNALIEVRSLNKEIRNLKQNNLQLTTKHMQLKMRFSDVSKSVEKERNYQNELLNMIQQENDEESEHISKYEDSLSEKAERFRKTRTYYNENEMAVEIEKVNNANVNLKREAERRQALVDELTRELEGLRPSTPGDLLNIIGKMKLDETLKTLTDKCETLHEKRNYILNSQSTAQSITGKF